MYNKMEPLLSRLWDTLNDVRCNDRCKLYTLNLLDSLYHQLENEAKTPEKKSAIRFNRAAAHLWFGDISHGNSLWGSSLNKHQNDELDKCDLPEIHKNNYAYSNSRRFYNEEPTEEIKEIFADCPDK